MNWFQSQSVVLQAFIAGLFTWGCTIVGSAIVFLFKHISRKLLDIMMGFAAGVMIATLGLMVGFVIMMILDVALG
nr:zinc transporter [Streptococcus sp. 400_SSPC]